MKEYLESLEKIDHTVCLAFNTDNNAIFNKDEYDHIDCKDIDEFVECYDTAEEGLRAVTIIIDKRVNMDLVHYSKTLEEYNSYYHRKLTQEEFDFLKRILKDE